MFEEVTFIHTEDASRVFGEKSTFAKPSVRNKVMCIYIFDNVMYKAVALYRKR